MTGRETVRLRSKRNLVEKVPLPGGGWGVRKDFGEDREGCRAELGMVRRLGEAGVRVAPIIQAEEPVILYRWLPGETLCDLLEQAEEDPVREKRLFSALPRLCQWLKGFYAASGGLILGDAHLRNFLLLPGGEIAGVDFEACCPGPREEDAARLVAFTLTYDPALTEKKRRLASLLLQDCCWELGLRLPDLEKALFAQLEGLCRRRGLSPEVRREYEKAGNSLLAVAAYLPICK